MYYTRVPIDAGDQEVKMIMKGRNIETVEHSLKVDSKKGQTIIYPFWPLASYEPVTMNRAK